MKALFITSFVLFLLFVSACESLLTVLGPVWFLGVGLGLLGAMMISGRETP